MGKCTFLNSLHERTSVNSEILYNCVVNTSNFCSLVPGKGTFHTCSRTINSAVVALVEPLGKQPKLKTKLCVVRRGIQF